jgi:hypothetical protein
MWNCDIQGILNTNCISAVDVSKFRYNTTESTSTTEVVARVTNLTKLSLPFGVNKTPIIPTTGNHKIQFSNPFTTNLSL